MGNTAHILYRCIGVLMMALLAACSSSDSSPPASTPGSIELSADLYKGTEGVDALVTVSVARTGGTDGDASVDYAVLDGTADSGDYSVTHTTGTLTWADGDAVSKTVDILLKDDAKVELTESLTVTLSNAVTATLGSNSSATVNIVDNDSISITGVVSAPNGSVAINNRSYMDRIFAALFVKPANATVSDLISPVPGVKVSVYEVDADGELLPPGSPLAVSTATTDGNGAYTLAAPLAAPASRYIVRAESASGFLDGRIISEYVNVDPVTDAASFLVASNATDLDTISIDEIELIQDEVDKLAENIDPTLLTATQLSNALSTEAQNEQDVYNVITSSAAAGTICGTVTDSGDQPLGGISIVVRDYSNWVTRAKTKTAADGRYCLNVPVAGATDVFTGNILTGEYIIGSINRTGDNNDPGRHASEWWSTGGAAYNQYDAEKISVTSAAVVSGKDFKLEPGVRIKGTVVASDTRVGLEGVKVVIRDFENRTPLVNARSRVDGSYRVNVIPGRYLVVARNKTIQPYASEIYDGHDGTNNRNFGTPVSVSAGSAATIDFPLQTGQRLSGTITDSGTAVAGMRVMVDNDVGGSAERLRTNRLGQYRIWLRPDTYDVYAYGQRNLGVDLTASDQTIDFSGTVKAVSTVLKDAGDNPLSQVKFRLYDSIGTYLGFEISNSDGMVTMHTDQTGDQYAEFTIDRASDVGGIIYDNQTQLQLGDPISVNASDIDLGMVTLPDGGVLTGKVYAGNAGDTTAPIANFSIELRDGDIYMTNRFVRISTRGDGSYLLTVPAGVYERVKMLDASRPTSGNCDDVVIKAGVITTLNYYDGDNTCEVKP